MQSCADNRANDCLRIPSSFASMKQFSTLLCSLCLGMSLVVGGCATASLPPAVQSVSGTESIAAGQTGVIRWSFANADYVAVAGIPGSFQPDDSVYVTPDITTAYRLTGYGGSDSAIAFFTMRVDTPQDANAQVETGGLVEGADEPVEFIAESSMPSFYYSGIAEKGDRPEVVKIMRALPAGKERPEFHAVVLDQYGNFLPNNASQFAPLKFSCVGSFSTLSRPANVEEVQAQHAPTVSVALCADYSYGVEDMVPALENAYRNFFRAFASEDEISFVRFDHRVETSFQLLASDRAAAELAPGSVYRGGLTAVYRAAWAGLKSLKKSSLSNKALVLVSAGSENSSLLYTVGDVAEAARTMNIPVYTIALGMDAETYSLRYLSDYSGGRFYQANSVEEVSAILREIAYSYRAYYTLSYPEPSTPTDEVAECPGMVYATLGMSGNMETLREMRLWNTDRQTYAPFHQIVSTFPATSFDVPTIYSEHITALATLLKDNPDKPVELTGHSEPGTSEEDDMVASLRRAQAVRDALLRLGVSAQQVRIRGAGGSTPMYYFAAQQWQQDLNRRVELRWLDPALLPFEIVAQTVFTEQEAEKLTVQWAERGQRAYYELVMAQRTPAFRIKLWGYDTYDSALDAKATLQKKYRVNLSVQ